MWWLGRIQDFCQGRAPREWWPYMGWEWAIFDIRKHRFATFQDVYCHIMPEWCWTTIQETPVSLLSALETREPAPKARVLPSQGWAPAPAPPPGSAPGRYGYNFRNLSPFRSPHATESITCYWESLAPWEGKLINSLMMKTTAQGRVVRFTPFRNFNFERTFQTIAGG